MIYSEAWRNAGFPDSLKYRSVSVYRAIIEALQERAQIMNVVLDPSFASAYACAAKNPAGRIKTQMRKLYQSLSCLKQDESVSFEEFFQQYHSSGNRKYGRTADAEMIGNFPLSLNCLSEKTVFSSDSATTFQKETKTLSFSYERANNEQFTMQEISSWILADYTAAPVSSATLNNRSIRILDSLDLCVSRSPGFSTVIYGTVQSENIRAVMTDSRNCRCKSYSCAYSDPENIFGGLVYTLNHECLLSAGSTATVDFSRPAWSSTLPFALNEQDMSSGSFELHRSRKTEGVFAKNYAVPGGFSYFLSNN